MKNNVIDFPKQVSKEHTIVNEIDLIFEIRGLLREFQNDYPLLIKRAILTRVDLLTKELVSMT